MVLGFEVGLSCWLFQICGIYYNSLLIPLCVTPVPLSYIVCARSAACTCAGVNYHCSRLRILLLLRAKADCIYMFLLVYLFETCSLLLFCACPWILASGCCYIHVLWPALQHALSASLLQLSKTLNAHSQKGVHPCTGHLLSSVVRNLCAKNDLATCLLSKLSEGEPTLVNSLL